MKTSFIISYEEVYGWSDQAMHLSSNVVDGEIKSINVDYRPGALTKTNYALLKEVNKSDCQYHLYPQWQKQYATHFDSREEAERALKSIQKDYSTCPGIKDATIEMTEEQTTTRKED